MLLRLWEKDKEMWCWFDLEELRREKRRRRSNGRFKGIKKWLKEKRKVLQGNVKLLGF